VRLRGRRNDQGWNQIHAAQRRDCGGVM
jgi:hypothetical protein